MEPHSITRNADQCPLFVSLNVGGSALHVPGMTGDNGVGLPAQMNSMNFQQTSISHYPYQQPQMAMPFFMPMPMLSMSFNQLQLPGYGNTYQAG